MDAHKVYSMDAHKVYSIHAHKESFLQALNSDMGKNKKNPLLNMDPTSNPTPDESTENMDNLSNFTKNRAPRRNNKKLPTMGLF